MKFGFTAMMSKHNPSLHNGSRKPHPDPKSTASSVQYESDADCEFLPCDQKMNKVYYLKLMKRLRKLVRRKRPDFLEPKILVAPS